MQPDQTSICDDYVDLDVSGVQKSKRKNHLLHCFLKLETPKVAEGKHVFFWEKGPAVRESKTDF